MGRPCRAKNRRRPYPTLHRPALLPRSNQPASKSAAESAPHAAIFLFIFFLMFSSPQNVRGNGCPIPVSYCDFTASAAFWTAFLWQVDAPESKTLQLLTVLCKTCCRQKTLWHTLNGKTPRRVPEKSKSLPSPS